MRNFSEHSVIGGVTNGMEFIPGSKFDDFDLLINRYYSLLFYTLIKSGITYDTGRNGVLARVRLEKDGFANYVQPCIGKWDYDNPRFRRIVSPDFVLYLFNNLCMEESYYRINLLVEPIQMSQGMALLPDGIEIDKFTVNGIIEKYDEYTKEYYNYINGYPNSYKQISETELAFVRLTYQLIERVTKYSREFYEHQIKVSEYTRLNRDIESGVLSYENLTREQNDLIDSDWYSGEYESCPDFYMSLGCFNNNIRAHALVQLGRERENYNKVKDVSVGEQLDGVEVYDNPISILEDYESPYEYDLVYDAKIDYTDAKEFQDDMTNSKKKKHTM